MHFKVYCYYSKEKHGVLGWRIGTILTSQLNKLGWFEAHWQSHHKFKTKGTSHWSLKMDLCLTKTLQIKDKYCFTYFLKISLKYLQPICATSLRKC